MPTLWVFNQIQFSKICTLHTGIYNLCYIYVEVKFGALGVHSFYFTCAIFELENTCDPLDHKFTFSKLFAIETNSTFQINVILILHFWQN